MRGGLSWSRQRDETQERGEKILLINDVEGAEFWQK